MFNVNITQKMKIISRKSIEKSCYHLKQKFNMRIILSSTVKIPPYLKHWYNDFLKLWNEKQQRRKILALKNSRHLSECIIFPFPTPTEQTAVKRVETQYQGWVKNIFLQNYWSIKKLMLFSFFKKKLWLFADSYATFCIQV